MEQLQQNQESILVRLAAIEELLKEQKGQQSLKVVPLQLTMLMMKTSPVGEAVMALAKISTQQQKNKMF